MYVIHTSKFIYFVFSQNYFIVCRSPYMNWPRSCRGSFLKRISNASDCSDSNDPTNGIGFFSFFTVVILSITVVTT